MGEGTQADLLHQRLNACHLSPGDVFLSAASRAECDQSPAIKAALQYMRRGDLVPDSIVWEMVLERSGCLRCGGFLLDGFPRTLAPAESLKQLMENQRLYATAVVNYRLLLDEIVSRLNGRRACRGCKAVCHATAGAAQGGGHLRPLWREIFSTGRGPAGLSQGAVGDV